MLCQAIEWTILIRMTDILLCLYKTVSPIIGLKVTGTHSMMCETEDGRANLIAPSFGITMWFRFQFMSAIIPPWSAMSGCLLLRGSVTSVLNPFYLFLTVHFPRYLYSVFFYCYCLNTIGVLDSIKEEQNVNKYIHMACICFLLPHWTYYRKFTWSIVFLRCTRLTFRSNCTCIYCSPRNIR